jgi:hypothetical protein
MSIQKISEIEYYIRMAVMILAASSPIIFLATQGYKPSLSSYWRTDAQPIFIIINATTSYYLYGIRRWKPAAILLLFLTAFSVQDYMITHNVLAVLFFVACLYPLHQNNHYRRVYFYLYLLSLPLMAINLLLAESISIIILCLYHAKILTRIYKIQNR